MLDPNVHSGLIKDHFHIVTGLFFLGFLNSARFLFTVD